MITLETTGAGEVLARLEALPRNVTNEVKKGVSRLVIKLQTKVVSEKLQGAVLNVRTGRGWRSIKFNVSEDGYQVVGVVSTKVFYMIGWETGWAARPVGSNPLAAAKAKSRFNIPTGGGAGGDTFKNGSPRKRPFLVPTLNEMAASGAVTAELQRAVERALRA